MLVQDKRIFYHNRRDFIKYMGLGTSSIMLSPYLSSCSAQGESELYQSFMSPAAEAKPFFRWWWNGNRLSKDEILRELELMKQAGIGGVEINPIKMPEQVQDPAGDAVDWLSNAWIDFLQYTIDTANDMGMISDLIVGTGWPFGGEFLKPEETIQGLTVEKWDLKGPMQKTIALPESDAGTSLNVKKIVLYPARIDSLNDAEEILPEEGKQSVELNIPAGEHQLFMLVWQNNFRTVMHGAPGGAGAVLDHFNKKAVNKYLNHMSDTIKAHTGHGTLKGIRAMFCDSIELNGANWTEGFENIFQERRGYDIMPYLPLLLSENPNIQPALEDELKRARYDYSLTLAEIFTESFIIPFHTWCHENGTLSRYQAYGHPWLYTDLIDGYMIPDIPEGDQWLFNGGWQPYADINQIRYAIWNKYASSGGHLAGRKIISTEAMTNTSGVFKASLKYIKQATDVNLATGINHQVLHGFNYSPPEAEFPGWIRYGCYFNENNPWWQYMPLWSNYTSRLSQIFQDSQPVSQIAIMGPTLDIWSNHGLDRNPFNLEPWYLHAFWQALNHVGFSNDFVNARLVSNAKLQNGKIIIGSMQYDALIICDVKTMDIKTAERIADLTTQGAKIIMIGQKPERSPSMIGALKNNGIVTKAIQTAMNSGILTAPSPDDNLKRSPDLLMEWARQLMKNSGLTPNVEITNPDPSIFFQHQKHGKTDILFLSNTSETESFSSSISFQSKTSHAVRWDPESGSRTKLPLNSKGFLDVELQPLGSMLIVFDTDERFDKREVVDQPDSNRTYEIDTNWQVTLKPVKGAQSNLTLNALKPLQEIDNLSDFGGSITYKCTFEIETNDYSELLLDKVYDTAEVFLNGHKLGLSWYGNNSFDLNDKLMNGKNSLEIKVTTVLANYMASLEDNTIARHWTRRYRDQPPVNCGLAGKVILR